MRITASGGTDGGNIVLFWPDNLPDGADEILINDPIALVEGLRNRGKLIWFPCDGDGGYTVTVFVRTPVPDDLLAHCEDEETIPILSAQGAGYFGGMEYMFKLESRRNKHYPGMLSEILIPEGSYTARVYCTSIPENLYDSWLRSRAGPAAKRLWDLHSVIAACAVAGVLASLVSVFLVKMTVWVWIAGFAGIAAGTAVGMSRTLWYKRVAEARRVFSEEYPSYVVHLEDMDPSANRSSPYGANVRTELRQASFL